MIIFFSDVLTLYPSSRPSNCIFSFTFVTILIKENIQKNDPCKNMGKYSKAMPLPKSTPPGKGGKPYGK